MSGSNVQIGWLHADKPDAAEAGDRRARMRSTVRPSSCVLPSSCPSSGSGVDSRTSPVAEDAVGGTGTDTCWVTEPVRWPDPERRRAAGRGAVGIERATDLGRRSP